MIPQPTKPLGDMLSGYITKGLLWRLDALQPMRNGSTGLLSTWQDLSGNGHDVALSSPVSFNGHSVPALAAAGRCTTWIPRNDIYVELVFANNKGYEMNGKHSTVFILFDKTSGWNTGIIGIAPQSNGTCSVYRGNCSPEKNPHNGVYAYGISAQPLNEIRSVSLFYKSPTAYVNGSRIQPDLINASFRIPYDNTVTEDDIINSRGTVGAAPLIASLRVYSRELTVAEIQHNFRLDRNRFNLR